MNKQGWIGLGAGLLLGAGLFVGSWIGNAKTQSASATARQFKHPAYPGGSGVVITEFGECYHKDPSCYGLKEATTEKYVSFEEAKRRGYRPCRLCVGSR